MQDINKRHYLGNAFVFMVRYSLPRKTSADMATTSALKVYWEEIPGSHKKMILEHIRDEKGFYGKDPFIWDDFLKWVDNKTVMEM